MQRIEGGDSNNTQLAADLIAEEPVIEKKVKKEVVIPPYEEIALPIYDEKPLVPPMWGRVALYGDSVNKDLIFKWINHRVLFRQRWGYKRGKQKTEEFIKHEQDVVEPLYDQLKEEFISKKLFDPIALYAYHPCISRENKLYVFDTKYLYNNQEEAQNIPPLEEAIEVFEFPRQEKKPHRCIADFFANDRLDVVTFTLASAGLAMSPYERELYDAGKFTDYYHVHGLGVELAEAAAEVIHKQIRLDLDIVANEGHTLQDVQMKQYTGCRYSPGYAACPDLEMNRQIFNILNPEEFGIELSETFQMHPEQTTCAIIVPHKDAAYYNI
jgi:5-methyltetrahydrofolate--homocysteine methyltransferase